MFQGTGTATRLPPSSGLGSPLGLKMLPLAACSAALAFSACVSPRAWRSPSRSLIAFGRAGVCRGLPALHLSTARVSPQKGVCVNTRGVVRHPRRVALLWAVIRASESGSAGRARSLGGLRGWGTNSRRLATLRRGMTTGGSAGRPSRHLRPGYAEHMGVRRKRAADAAPFLREAGKRRGAWPAPAFLGVTC